LYKKKRKKNIARQILEDLRLQDNNKQK